MTTSLNAEKATTPKISY